MNRKKPRPLTIHMVMDFIGWTFMNIDHRRLMISLCTEMLHEYLYLPECDEFYITCYARKPRHVPRAHLWRLYSTSGTGTGALEGISSLQLTYGTLRAIGVLHAHGYRWAHVWRYE